MDQFVVALGIEKHALLIDCRSLASRPVELKLGEYAIVICDTRVKHQLASSEYNRRREECEQGVRILQEFLPAIRALRDVTTLDFVKLSDQLPDVIKKRCRHVITENVRTLAAVRALENGNINEIGELMSLSHESLRDDYAVSCPELDQMFEIAMQTEGVAGARMTGGGFGGCTINLVEQKFVPQFIETIIVEYAQATGIEPTIYLSNAAAGAQEI